MDSPSIPFPDESMGPDQEPWLELLETGEFPDRPPSELPGAWMVQKEWKQLLRAAIRRPGGGHGLAFLHLGVMEFHARRYKASAAAWEKSLSLSPSAWGYRNLAVYHVFRRNLGEASDLFIKALALEPALFPLVVECGRCLLAGERPAEFLEMLSSLPPSIRKHGRIRLLEGFAALDAGDLERTDRILSGEFELSDIREGELSLTDLWFRLQEEKISAKEGVPINDALRRRIIEEIQPPAWLDFRMGTAWDGHRRRRRHRRRKQRPF